MFAASLSALSAARGTAAFAGAIGVGFTAGSLVAGAVAAVGSWRAALVLTVPCCLAAAVLATRLERGRRGPPGVSWPVALGVGAIVAGGAAGTSLAGLPATAVAAAAIVAFAHHLGARPVAVACAAGLVLNGTCVAGTLAIALLLQDGHGPLATGGILGCFGVVALPAARLAARRAPGPLVAAGLAVQGAALAGAAATRAELAVAGCVAALGFGHVLGSAATADLATRATPAHGVVAGALGSAQRLGGALGPLLLAPTPNGLALAGAAGLVTAALAWLALIDVPRR
jgi:YNFM family putative membrane transporter